RRRADDRPDAVHEVRRRRRGERDRRERSRRLDRHVERDVRERRRKVVRAGRADLDAVVREERMVHADGAEQRHARRGGSGSADAGISMKITDLPGAMLVTSWSRTAEPAEKELSSIFHPVTSTGVAPRFVNSNQSSAYGLLPLAHGAASETTTLPGAAFSFTTS